MSRLANEDEARRDQRATRKGGCIREIFYRGVWNRHMKLMIKPFLIGIIAIAVFTGSSAFGQAPGTIAVKAARLLDVRTGTVLRDAVVLVQTGRITAVGE